MPNISRRVFLSTCAASTLGACASMPKQGIAAMAENASAGGLPSPDVVVDAHCHIFSARDLDLDAFLRGLARVEELPKTLKPSLEYITGLIHRALYGAHDKEKARRLVRAVLSTPAFKDQPQLSVLADVITRLEPVTGTVEQIEARLEQEFPAVSLFLPSMVDFKYAVPHRQGLGEPTPLSQQLDNMEALAKAVNARPAGQKRMLPLAAFNPLREVLEGGHLADALRAVLERGFVGFKVYPPTGFAPTNNADNPRLDARVSYDGTSQSMGRALDRVLDRFYERCEAQDIPIMAHANNSNAMRKGSGFYASPWGWREVLSDHGDLRLNLGHFGHMEGASADDFDSSPCVSWAKHIAELMAKCEHVYADVGYSVLLSDTSPQFSQRYDAYLKEMEVASESKLSERLMYGSDWWMCLLETDAQSYYSNVHAWFRAHRAEWQGFDARNALRFLGLDDPGNANRKRMEQRWRSASSADAPAEWLTALIELAST